MNRHMIYHHYQTIIIKNNQVFKTMITQMFIKLADRCVNQQKVLT